MNIGSLLPRHAHYRPDHLALVVGKHRLSYSEFNVQVNRLANALLAQGISKGEKLATLLPNCLELMTAYWAAAKTGVVIVPLSTLLQKSGLAALLKDSDAVALLAHPSFTDTLKSLREELSAVRHVILVGAEEHREYQSYDDFVARASEDEPPDAELRDSDIYNIMYSSGTTGAPKGIVHTHYIRAMYCSLFASAWRMTPESVVLHSGSIVFNGAMLDLMPWMFVGGTYILHETFDTEAVIRDIKQKKVTHMIMVPSQIIAMLGSPDFNADSLDSLEMIQNVGAPLLLEHKRRLNALLPGRFYELYGLTEGFVTVLDRTDAIRKAGSVGAPLPFFEIRILEDNGKQCAPGEVGEICGKGPIMMPGYYKRPDLTEKAIVDGWLHTGDAGYLDEEGFLYLVDRMKDMIITGGVNVYPKDIEEIIIRHPAVTEVAVFGYPHDKWGETPVAAVILHQGETTESQALVEWTNLRVDAKFQRISDVFIMDDFPRNVAGKTLKHEIRARYTGSTQ